MSGQRSKVAVIGATGIAGQQFLACLAPHPWFKVTALAGSSRSAGKPYAEGIKSPGGATGWWAEGEVPDEFKGMVIQDSGKFDPGSVDLIFSAVESDVAKVLVRAGQPQHQDGRGQGRGAGGGAVESEGPDLTGAPPRETKIG